MKNWSHLMPYFVVNYSSSFSVHIQFFYLNQSLLKLIVSETQINRWRCESADFDRCARLGQPLVTGGDYGDPTVHRRAGAGSPESHA